MPLKACLLRSDYRSSTFDPVDANTRIPVKGVFLKGCNFGLACADLLRKRDQHDS